jgi:hypothetical protein
MGAKEIFSVLAGRLLQGPHLLKRNSDMRLEPHRSFLETRLEFSTPKKSRLPKDIYFL